MRASEKDAGSDKGAALSRELGIKWKLFFTCSVLCYVLNCIYFLALMLWVDIAQTHSN